jgi:ABC-type glycerol-3-phosphate transport system substrate-binding protein
MMWPVEWQSEWRVAPLPRGAIAASSANIEAFAISASTPDRDASWHWVTFLSRQTTYRLIPARRSLSESEAFEQAVGKEVAAVARFSLEDAIIVSPQYGAALSDDFERFTSAVGQIIEGAMTPAEAMDAAALQSGR